MQTESTEYVGVTWRLTLTFWMGSICRTSLGGMEEVNGGQIDVMRPWKCHSIHTYMLLSASIITIVNNTHIHTRVQIKESNDLSLFLFLLSLMFWCVYPCPTNIEYRKVLRLLVMINKFYPTKCYTVNSVANPFKSLNIKINNDSFNNKALSLC